MVQGTVQRLVRPVYVTLEFDSLTRLNRLSDKFATEPFVSLEKK